MTIQGEEMYWIVESQSGVNPQRMCLLGSGATRKAALEKLSRGKCKFVTRTTQEKEVTCEL